MDKKKCFAIGGRNLNFLVVVFFATITFMMQISTTFDVLRFDGPIINISYNIFRVKIATATAYRNIPNYPLIPIIPGIIYNIFVMIKNRSKGEEVESHINSEGDCS